MNAKPRMLIRSRCWKPGLIARILIGAMSPPPNRAALQ